MFIIVLQMTMPRTACCSDNLIFRATIDWGLNLKPRGMSNELRQHLPKTLITIPQCLHMTQKHKARRRLQSFHQTV